MTDSTKPENTDPELPKGEKLAAEARGGIDTEGLQADDAGRAPNEAGSGATGSAATGSAATGSAATDSTTLPPSVVASPAAPLADQTSGPDSTAPDVSRPTTSTSANAHFAAPSQGTPTEAAPAQGAPAHGTRGSTGYWPDADAHASPEAPPSAAAPAPTGRRAHPAQFGTIVWGFLLLALCAVVAITQFGPGLDADRYLWAFVGVIVAGVALVAVGIAAAVRR
jgi:hypothetical protein